MLDSNSDLRLYLFVDSWVEVNLALKMKKKVIQKKGKCIWSSPVRILSIVYVCGAYKTANQLNFKCFVFLFLFFFLLTFDQQVVNGDGIMTTAMMIGD